MHPTIYIYIYIYISLSLSLLFSISQRPAKLLVISFFGCGGSVIFFFLQGEIIKPSQRQISLLEALSPVAPIHLRKVVNSWGRSGELLEKSRGTSGEVCKSSGEPLDCS